MRKKRMSTALLVMLLLMLTGCSFSFLSSKMAVRAKITESTPRKDDIAYIKLYANKPSYKDEHFQVAEGVFFAGDGAGTSRGITGAWASGIRASEGMVEYLK